MTSRLAARLFSVAIPLTSEISSTNTECGLRGDKTSDVSPGLRVSVFGASVWDYAAVDLAVAGIKTHFTFVGKK